MSDPTIATRLWAAVKGEVHGRDLEAYRRAGHGVYDQLDAIESVRLQMMLDGVSPWDVDQATQVRLFASWTAFVLQTLADDFVSADYEADSRTVGFVPPVTEEQAMRLYSQVAGWLSVAEQARVNPEYPNTVTITVDLPEWVDVEPCPREHLQAMIDAADKLGSKVEDLRLEVGRADLSPTQGKELVAVDELIAHANVYRTQAQDLWGGQNKVSGALHESIEIAVKLALDAFNDAGQLLTMPALIKTHSTKDTSAKARVPSGSKLAQPGERGFDQWCLTDPTSVDRWKRDRTAVEAIGHLWENDPSPAKTLRIQAEIDAAFGSGDLVFSGDGNYYCCPWSAIYRIIRPVLIGGVRLRRGQTFTFDVSAEEIEEGGEFKREILAANFSPTKEIDYCMPGAGHDD